jgi:hypothetical protein
LTVTGPGVRIPLSPHFKLNAPLGHFLVGEHRMLAFQTEHNENGWAMK